MRDEHRPVGERVLSWGLIVAIPLVTLIGAYLILHAREPGGQVPVRDPSHLYAEPVKEERPTVVLTPVLVAPKSGP